MPGVGKEPPPTAALDFSTQALLADEVRGVLDLGFTYSRAPICTTPTVDGISDDTLNLAVLDPVDKRGPCECATSRAEVPSAFAKRSWIGPFIVLTCNGPLGNTGGEETPAPDDDRGGFGLDGRGADEKRICPANGGGDEALSTPPEKIGGEGAGDVSPHSTDAGTADGTAAAVTGARTLTCTIGEIAQAVALGVRTCACTAGAVNSSPCTLR